MQADLRVYAARNIHDVLLSHFLYIQPDTSWSDILDLSVRICSKSLWEPCPRKVQRGIKHSEHNKQRQVFGRCHCAPKSSRWILLPNCFIIQFPIKEEKIYSLIPDKWHLHRFKTGGLEKGQGGKPSSK